MSDSRTTITSYPKMELLAPAGNMACAIAAFDAGADAVYAGLKKFNARERTDNFSVEEMASLIEYAHADSKKVYVTFNTLVKESELRDAASALSELDRIRPNAVIVQDIGILRIIRDFFPNLKIHASTQMGLHNSAGIKLAAHEGISRVILERQTTLNEIKLIKKNSPPDIELELFVHGALCCCLSGTCMLSSWMGGWSGNRGKCKQPCRREYFNLDGNGSFDPSKGSYILSPHDLCAAELLSEFREIGIASIKIEGRLKRADYISKVVSAYRLLLDATPDNYRNAEDEAKELFFRSYTRKPSLGFYTEQSTGNLIRHETSGTLGLLCGKVVKRTPQGFAAQLSRKLHVGDNIRVQSSDSEEGVTFSILKISVDNTPVMKALPGQTCFIHTDREIGRDASIWKIGESCPDYAKRINAIPNARTHIDLGIKLSASSIAVSVENLAEKKIWSATLNLSPADKRPLAEETLISEFASSASDKFCAGKINAEIEGNLFFPSSLLKSVRRDFWLWVEKEITKDSPDKVHQERLEAFFKHYDSLKPAGKTFRNSVIHGKDFSMSGDIIKVCEITSANAASADEVMLPFFVTEKELPGLCEKIKMLIKSGVKTFRATSLHHFGILRDFKDITIKTSIPLPVCNSIAAEEAGMLGAVCIQPWIELEKCELENLIRKSPVPMEIYVYGRPVIFATRAPVNASGRITDGRRNSFRVEKAGKLTVILPEKVMRIELKDGEFAASQCIDLRHAEKDEKESSSFNYMTVLS